MEVCIVGGGSSGISAAKACKDRGLVPFILEKDSNFGGTWNPNTSQVGAWNSIHLNFDRWVYGFTDHLWKPSAPAFPSLEEVVEYLESYISKHDLLQYFHFNSKVTFADKVDDGYLVRWQTGDIIHEKVFRALIIAHGPLVKKSGISDFSAFRGTVLHSSDYREPSIFLNKKVVVVGNSFSACDICNEALPYASSITQVFRNKKLLTLKVYENNTPYTFEFLSLKHMLSIPILFNYGAEYDQFQKESLKRLGNPGRFNPLLQVDPEICDFNLTTCVEKDYLEAIGDGRVILLNGEYTHFSENRVLLKDGREIEADVVILATGYARDFSFLGKNLKNILKINEESDPVGMTAFRSILHHDLPNFGFVAQAYLPVPNRFSITSDIIVDWILGTLKISYDEIKEEVSKEDEIRKKFPKDRVFFYNMYGYAKELLRISGTELNLEKIEQEFQVKNPFMINQLYYLDKPEIMELAKTAFNELKEKFPKYFSNEVN